MLIEKMMMVSINYNLTNGSGELIDSSDGHGPLVYIQGMGEIIPGLEEELEGKKSGDKLNVTIPAEKAYGKKREDMIISVPKDRFGDNEYKVGDMIELHDGNSGAIPAKILEFKDDVVVLDGNHPLADQTLIFDVEVVEVRAATEEELAALTSSSSCGSGGGCCGSDEETPDSKDNGGCNSGGCCCS